MVIMSSTKLIREGFNKQKNGKLSTFCGYASYPPPLIHLAKVNKDHQRMMVDPVLMIVQSLRSFLTAVTPTAVVPIADILPVFIIYQNLPEFS